ncbi:hypothetical protein NH340_JMT02123 [Sarcoptes scabiei]|nr:hypothetical protein NH340_JMT02123 [Sarcoptes scabiei]
MHEFNAFEYYNSILSTIETKQLNSLHSSTNDSSTSTSTSTSLSLNNLGENHRNNLVVCTLRPTVRVQKHRDRRSNENQKSLISIKSISSSTSATSHPYSFSNHHYSQQSSDDLNGKKSLPNLLIDGDGSVGGDPNEFHHRHRFEIDDLHSTSRSSINHQSISKQIHRPNHSKLNYKQKFHHQFSSSSSSAVTKTTAAAASATSASKSTTLTNEKLADSLLLRSPCSSSPSPLSSVSASSSELSLIQARSSSIINANAVKFNRNHHNHHQFHHNHHHNHPHPHQPHHINNQSDVIGSDSGNSSLNTIDSDSQKSVNSGSITIVNEDHYRRDQNSHDDFDHDDVDDKVIPLNSETNQLEHQEINCKNHPNAFLNNGLIGPSGSVDDVNQIHFNDHCRDLDVDVDLNHQDDDNTISDVVDYDDADDDDERNCLLLNVFVPEAHSEFDITCSNDQSIWLVKKTLIERCSEHEIFQQNNLKQQIQFLNYGLFSNRLGLFLDEEQTLLEFLHDHPTLLWYYHHHNHHHHQNHHHYHCGDIGETFLSSSHKQDNLLARDERYKAAISQRHNQQRNLQANLLRCDHCISSSSHHQTYRREKFILELEFIYKQRTKGYGAIMSTLPLASATRKKRKRSRLINQIQNGNVEKLSKILVDCDPNFIDENSGETPLSLAASQPGSVSNNVVQQLLVALVNGGAMLDFRTKDGRTALHAAVKKSNFIALKTLLDLGASPNYLDSNGLTPLYYTVIYKANIKLAQLLLYEHAQHGITDQHGWQEIHHASKLGLVQHLEQLLFYGCDMNCRIVGSGNTSLHVAAINDQMECARILLLRGCDTSIVNNSHQNAHQVAVIAANMALADFIKNHKPENVAPYRDKPRFNPARRPQNSIIKTDTPSKQHLTLAAKLLSVEMNGASSALDHRSISPSAISQFTNNTTTTSSGVCCDDDDDNNNNNNNNENNDNYNKNNDRTIGKYPPPPLSPPSIASQEKNDESILDSSVRINQKHPNGTENENNLGNKNLNSFDGDIERNNQTDQIQNDVEREEGDEDYDDGDDDDDAISNGNRIISQSESEDSGVFSPGMIVKAISDYNSGDPSHMQLRRNDHVLLLHSDHSPPTIASQKLLLGRRCLDNVEGYFPACCVEKIKPIKENGDCRVEGRRNLKMKNLQSATLPTRGRRGARKSYLDKNVTRQYQDRTVTLLRGSKGFGFVLRGAKDSSPILTKQLMQQGSQMPLIGLQYFDEIESGGVADAAGLKRGDFLLAVNDVDVRHMSHEKVVQLIRQSGDKVTMMIATPVPKQLVSILKKKSSNEAGQTNAKALPSLSHRHQASPSKLSQSTLTNGDQLGSNRSQMQMSQSVYASFTQNPSRTVKAPPPAPPKRDPSTTLSTNSRQRARSLVVASEVRSAHNQSIDLINSSTNQSKAMMIDGSSNNENNEDSRMKKDLNGQKSSKRDSCTMSPPRSPLHLNSTTAKQTTIENGKQISTFSSQNGTQRPNIPEPDYSSCDEDDARPKTDENKNEQRKDLNDNNRKNAEKIKFTTKATVVLKSTSPAPHRPSNLDASKMDEINGDLPPPPSPPSSQNIFDELKEQSAKITSAARLRLKAQENNSESIVEKTHSSNVKKNIAELEKRLNGTSIKDILENQIRMSRSCLDELASGQIQQSQTLNEVKKAVQMRQNKPSTANNDTNDLRRNSAIISAMAEKVAAVNQLIAEQQQIQQLKSGSKSLNSSPIPIGIGKLSSSQINAGSVGSSSTVVVQKPIALHHPNSSVMVPSGSATLQHHRRCVTVCEDPIKNVHLQQQHQQMRSKLIGTGNSVMMVAGNQSTLPKFVQNKTNQSASLSESTNLVQNLVQTKIQPNQPATNSIGL